MQLHTVEFNSHKEIYSIGDHHHNYYEVVYYLTGNGEIRIDKEIFPYSQNTFSITKPGSHHDEYSFAPVNLLYIGFSMDENANTDFLKNGVYACTKDDHILTLMKEILYESQTKGFYYDTQTEYLLQALITLVKRNLLKTQTKSTEMFDVQEYIRNNAHKNLNAKILAKHFNYNYDYFRKEFKKYFHVTINEFIITEQINYATNLIRTTNLSIAKIAKKSGFSSTSHFINCFKKQYNVTPKKWIVRDVKG